MRQPKVNLLDVLAQQANDETLRDWRGNGVTLAKLNLAQVLQLEASASDALDVAPPSDDLMESTVLPVNADAAVAFALGSFPDMKAAELQVTDAYLGLDLAKAARMPRIVGSYSMGSGYSANRLEQIGESTTTFYEIPTTTPGVNLTAPVVDDSGVTFETMSFQDQLSNNVNQSIFFSLSIPVFNNFGIHAGIERAKVGVLSAQLSKKPNGTKPHANRSNRVGRRPGSRTHLRSQRQSLGSGQLGHGQRRGPV